MKFLLLIFVLLYCFLLNAQSGSSDTLRYESGNIYWISKHIDADPENYHITYYYENGKKKLEEISDTSYVTKKKVNFWLPNGEQLIKNGQGKYIEVGIDSLVYTILDSIIKGRAEIYTRYYLYKQVKYSPWKINGNGNYEKDFKNGLWNFKDSSGVKYCTVNYVNDTLDGECRLFYPGSGNLKASGSIYNCKKEGLWKFYDDNGKPESEYNYSNGIKNGPCILYFHDGKIKAKGQYSQAYRKIRIAGENPYSPGTFIPKKRQFFVALKTGIWYYYDENGALLKSEKIKNIVECPENYETIRYKHHLIYSQTMMPGLQIPGCNYR